MIGKKGYEYLLGKANGTGTIKIFMEKLGLEASDEQMKEILQIVKDRSNLVKGNVSEVEFEYIARKYLENKSGKVVEITYNSSIVFARGVLLQD